MELTTKAQEAFSSAVRAATAAGHPHVEPAHLLAALAQQPDTTTSALLESVGSSAAQAAETAAKALAALPAVSGSTVSPPQLARATQQVLQQAQEAMTELGDTFVSTDHLLVALARTGAFGLDADAILTRVPELRGGRKVTTENPEAQYDALEKYGVDLTAAARDGKL